MVLEGLVILLEFAIYRYTAKEISWQKILVTCLLVNIFSAVIGNICLVMGIEIFMSGRTTSRGGALHDF